MANSISSITQTDNHITIVGTCDTTGGIVNIPLAHGVKSFRTQAQSTGRTGTSPTLTLKMQDSVDGGTTWNDLTSFTWAQFTGGANVVDTLVTYSAGESRLMRLYGTIGGSATPSVSFQVDLELLYV